MAKARMNKRILLWIVVVLYISSMAAAFFITRMVVEKKDTRLRVEAINSLRDFFSQQDRFINVGYSGKTVAYEEIPIPPKPRKYPQTFMDTLYTYLNPYEKRLEEWKEEYGDLYKLYQLKPKYVSEQSWNSDSQWTGWLLYGVEYNGQTVAEFQIYPYEVGLKRQTEAWLYIYMPSIQEAVDESFEFHTNNAKSSYINNLVKHDDIDMNAVRDRVDNEYYRLWSYDDWCNWLGKSSVDSTISCTNWLSYPVPTYYLPCEHYINDHNSVNCGGMYNGYYTVRNKYVRRAIWEIKYNWAWNPKATDLKNLQKWSFGTLTFLFVICLIPLLILITKEDRIKNETLKEKLIRLCNPQLLLKDKPYNKEQTDAANVLYQEIVATNEEDKEKLTELRIRATDEFGVSFINQQELEMLKKKCNPQKYMKPYNAEKVSLANELYAILNSDSLTYSEMKDVEERVNIL